MDDIIYILLGLVWIGLAFYRNSQKKKLQKTRMEQQEKMEEGTEIPPEKEHVSLLDELLMGQKTTSFFEEFDEEEPSKIPYAEEEQEIESEPVESFEEEYDELGIDSVEEIDASTAEKIFESLLEQQETIEIQHLGDEGKEPFEFDLRKAVIYSEILNSRYF